MKNTLETFSPATNARCGSVLRVLLFSCACLWVVACGGPSATKSGPIVQAPDTTPVADSPPPSDPGLQAPSLPEIPATAAPAPAGLMAEVILSNPHKQLTRVGLFMDAVQPGIGAFVTPQAFLQMLSGMTGARNLQGVDLNGPLFIAVLDTQEIVIVVTMASEAELRTSIEGGRLHLLAHDGLAAIGTAKGLTTVAPYVLSNLAKTRASALPTLNLHIAKTMQGPMGPDMREQIERRMLIAGSDPVAIATVSEIFNNIGVIRTSLDTSQAGATVLVEADVAGGPIKAFVEKQRPAEFSMIKRIGTGPWGVVAAGRLDFSVFAPILVAFGEAQANPVLTQIAAQVSSLNGEMAIGINLPNKPELAMAMELQDAKGVAQVVDTLMALASKKKDHDLAGMSTKVKLNSIRTRGGSLHEVRAKPSTPRQIEQYGKKNVSGFFGVSVNNLIATFGHNAKKHAKILSAASGKIAGKGSKLSAAIALATSARESLVIAMDVLSGQGERPPKDVDPLILGVGFGDGTIRARLVIPTELVLEGMKLGLF